MEHEQESVLLDTIVEFYDPHPGIAGAGARLPASFQHVAQKLVGARMSLLEAKVLFDTLLATMGSAEVKFASSFVSLSIPSREDAKRFACARYMWKVISFRPEIDALDDELMRRIKRSARMRRAQEGTVD